MPYIISPESKCHCCGQELPNPDVSCSAPAAGSVPSVELTKLLDVWSIRADEDCVPNDFNRGLQKAFQICSDGLRRKM